MSEKTQQVPPPADAKLASGASTVSRSFSGWPGRQLFERLVSLMEWGMARVHPSGGDSSMDGGFWAEHEELYLCIPQDAPIFGGSDVWPGVAIERTRLRAKHGGRVATARRAAQGALIGFLVFVFGQHIVKAITRHQLGDALLEVVLVVTLAIFTSAMWAAVFRRAEGDTRAACAHLGADGGLDRKRAVLEWFERHWAWHTPPEMLVHRCADLQATRRGRNLLVLSEVDYTRHYTLLRRSVHRTCVFIARSGGPSRKLGARFLPGRQAAVHVAITPAGLFAYWAGASLFGELAPESWATLLDGLLDLADQETSNAPPPRQAG